MKQRFFNMYLTTTISVAMVLFLLGLECVVLLSAHQLLRRVRENVALTVVLSDKADSTHVARLETLLEVASYCHDARYISKQDALDEHIRTLGEDPQKFLGYNPLAASYEVHLNADYACEDSIADIETQLMGLPYVEKVTHPQEVVSLLDLHVGEISLALVVLALVLLLISLALIVNTVRLHVYSKRFIIHTMRLVGATSWVIRAPFVKRNVRLGCEAGLIALAVLAAALYYIRMRLGIWLFDLTWQNITIVAATVLIGGELITLVASWIATGRYVRMKTDKMYEI